MKTIGVLIFTCLLASCGQEYRNSISGNGKVVQKEIKIDSFSVINVSDKIDVEIHIANDPKVIIEADENLIGCILIDVKGSILSISSDKNIRLARSKKVKVFCNNLKEIQASSRSNVFQSSALKIENLKINAHSAADVNLTGDFKNVDINGSSGSDITLSGSTTSMSVNLSSAADLNAYDIVTERASVDVSSAADARINVSKEAYLRASSAGNILYKGAPSIIDCKSSSAGDIKRSSY